LIRRLTHNDDALLREAFHWDVDRPTWYTQMDRVFSWGGEEGFVRLLDDRRNVLIGVFNPELIAVIIVVLEDYGLFTAHLCAKRNADVDLIVQAAQTVLYDLLEFDLRELYVWVAEKHRSLKRLCSMIGMERDGIRMFKGSYRGRLICWHRYSIHVERLEVAA